jgi:uncharacterized protein YjbI with pentapeptide repeats
LLPLPLGGGEGWGEGAFHAACFLMYFQWPRSGIKAMEDKPIESEKNSNEIEQLRAELIAQDHRLFTTLRRYFIERKTWPKDDPRHAAVKMALIYAFFSPAAIAVGGGGIALASLGVLLWQNSILLDQNGLISSQNSFMQEQIRSNNRQWTAERKASLLSIIYDKKPCEEDEDKECPKGYICIKRERKECPASNLVARTNAVESYIRIKKEECVRPECRVEISNLELKGAYFSSGNMQNVTLAESDLRGVDFNDFYAPGIKIIRSSTNHTNFKKSTITGCEIYLNNSSMDDDRFGMALTRGFYQFSSSDLDQCKITIPDGHGTAVCFNGSNLTGIKLKISNDNELMWGNSYLEFLDFSYANISSVDLSNFHELNKDQFVGACSDGGEKLPFKISLPKCARKRPYVPENTYCDKIRFRLLEETYSHMLGTSNSTYQKRKKASE